MALQWVLKLSPKTIAHSLEIVPVWSVAILSWTWNPRDFRFVNQWFFRVMRETITFSFSDRLFKDSPFLVLTRWGDIGFTFEAELLSVAEGGGPFAKSGYFVVVVGRGWNIMGRRESVGLGERVELLGPRAIELRSGSFDKGIHLVAIKLINL